jgi:carotenoid 1,2-hydratase
LTVIAFVGSVFSPYYAWARRRQGDALAPAESHCALNVALYRRPAGSSRFEHLWAMTERGERAVHRAPERLKIGPSQLAWIGDTLQIDIDEWTAPLPQRLRGRISVQTQALPCCSFPLDAEARHHWQPISPSARIDVVLDQPRLHWQGGAYVDSNHGSRPLERDFADWHWSRAALPDGRSQVVYDLRALDGSERNLALAFGADGVARPVVAPPRCALPASAWGLQRQARCDTGAAPVAWASLESGPFYSRSLLRSRWGGVSVTAVHESLSLRRFASPWVQWMLPFRMPRRG